MAPIPPTSVAGSTKSQGRSHKHIDHAGRRKQFVAEGGEHDYHPATPISYAKWVKTAGELGLAAEATQTTIRVASGMGVDSAPMSLVRTIAHGAKIANIGDEAKILTYTTGNEHALVKLADGTRPLVSGGEGGIDFAEGQITRLFGHTHP